MKLEVGDVSIVRFDWQISFKQILDGSIVGWSIGSDAYVFPQNFV